MTFEEWAERYRSDNNYGHGMIEKSARDAWDAAIAAERERHEAEVKGLVAKWREKATRNLVLGLYSDDLQRCAQELEALLRPHVSGELRRE
jgi:hypothetical protein